MVSAIAGKGERHSARKRCCGDSGGNGRDGAAATTLRSISKSQAGQTITGVRIRHTIQPVEGIDKIYPKTPSLSCRSSDSVAKKDLPACKRLKNGRQARRSTQLAQRHYYRLSPYPDLQYCISIHILMCTLLEEDAAMVKLGIKLLGPWGKRR